MPALMHTHSQNFFLTYPQLFSKAMQDYVRVDGTPKLEKERLMLSSFIRRGRGVDCSAMPLRIARAWR